MLPLLVGGTADPHRLYPYKVVNSIGILRELSRRLPKVELDYKAIGPRLLRLYIAISLTLSVAFFYYILHIPMGLRGRLD